jgi:rhamnulokinase
MEANFIAIDLGASSGRVLLGRWDGRQFELEELHRFPNEPVQLEGHLHWDTGRLWSEIKTGLSRYPAAYKEPLVSLGVDSWAVDFGLLDETGNLLVQPYHYRDKRTEGIPEQVFQQVSQREIFASTGIQFLPFNTLYQLYSMAVANDPHLAQAKTFLMIPDLIHYWLSGRQVIEYTNATTTQFFSCRERAWDTALLNRLKIPTGFLQPPVQPGTNLGPLKPSLLAELGFRQQQQISVIAPATHDTASAVAGVPGLDEHSAYLSSGTWSLLGVETGQPNTSEQAQALNFTNEGGVGEKIRLLKNIAGLWLLQECQRVWRQAGQAFSWEDLLRQAEQAPPFGSLIDPDAPEFLSPANMMGAIQSYCMRTGQAAPQSPGAIIRCCLESLAFKYRVVLESLESLTGWKLEAVRVVGGGSQNELLCQFTANACNRRVVAGPVEATALGNIMVQAIATGYLPDIAAGRRAVAASAGTVSYNPQSEPGWEETFERFKKLLG